MGKSSTVRVDRPPVSSESTYTAISFGHKIRSQRAAVVKTWAVVTKSSRVEPDGRRVTRSTDRHLAELATSDPETIARHLAELEKAGAVTIQGNGRRLIVVHDRAEGVGDWRINLFDDHPAWALSPRAFKVYLGLRKFAGKNTSCNPTDQTLAEFLAMSIDSVNRGMDELRKCMGIVTTCSPFDRDRRTKARTIHLAPAKRWIITKPVDPPPDPKSASLNTSMGADFGFDDRPERVDPTRKSAPEQSEICTPTIRNLHLNNPKSAPIEVLREEKKEPEPNPLPPKLSGQSESEPERVVVVGSGSVPPPDTDPKTALADELIQRFANLIEASALNAIERTDFRRALRKLIADHGPIPGQWIEAAVGVKPSKNTISVGSVAIKNLRRWTELTAEERAAIPDQTQLEMHEEETAKRKARLERLRSPDSPQVVRSKFDGQERVQRADGTWANKALPPENGSGTPVHAILTQRRGPIPAPSHIPNLMPSQSKTQNENTQTIYFSRVASLPLSGVQLKPFIDALHNVPKDLEPAAYTAVLERILAEAVEAVPPPPPPLDPAELERRRRERAEAEQREQRNRIEAERNQLRVERAKEIDTRTKAFEQRELLRIPANCPGNLDDAITEFRTITLPAKKAEIEAAVRAEFAPKFAALGPPPPPARARKPPGPPPGPPATIPAMASR
jgi:hypothetical protein